MNKVRNLSVDELKQEQIHLINDIYALAKSKGLSNDDIEPIPDGVNDLEAYVKSNPRVMWVLKEPYDNFKTDGTPCDGGWNLFDAFDKDDAWTNRSWQPIIYVLKGIFDKLLSWDDMDWIRDDKTMTELLKRIAYINVSKMPGMTSTDGNKILEDYQIWKDILLHQINTYAPDVIYFGNTFNYFKADLVGVEAEPDDSIFADGMNVVDIYHKDGITLCDTYHPNQKTVLRKNYIDSLIQAAGK